MAFPYIGCKISLLSKHGIRYEGTLYTIDPNDATIALSNVRCFGTEGRRQRDNLPEVEAAPEIFEYIIFKGNDIADLTVCDPTPTTDHSAMGNQRPAPVAAPAPMPAPVGPPPTSNPFPPAPQTTSAPMPATTGFAVPQPLPVGARPRPAQAPKAAPAPAQAPAPTSYSGAARGRSGHTNERLGTGELLVQRRVKKSGAGGMVDVSTDYDFEVMNANFDKTALTEECTEDPALKTVEVGYKPKSSFFDSISCETLDRQKTREQSDRKGYAEMRKQDLETFGETFGRSGGGYRGNRSRGGNHGGGNHGGGEGGGNSGGGKGGRRRRQGGGGGGGGGWKTQGRSQGGH